MCRVIRSSLARNRRAISRIVAFSSAVLLIVAAGCLGLIFYTASVVDPPTLAELIDTAVKADVVDNPEVV